MSVVANMMASVLPVTVAPHDQPPVEPAEIKATPERRASSAFSSTLRSVQRTHGVSSLGQRAEVSEPRQDRMEEDQKPMVRDTAERRSDEGKAHSRSVGAAGEARRESGKSKGADTETPVSDGIGIPVMLDQSERALGDQLDVSIEEGTATMQEETARSFEPGEMPEALDAGLPAGLKVGAAMVGLVPAVRSGSPDQTMPAPVVSDETEDHRPQKIRMEVSIAQPSGAGVEGFLRSNHQTSRPTISEPLLNDLMRAEPSDSPSNQSRSLTVLTEDVGGSSMPGHGGDAGRPLDQMTPGQFHSSEIRHHDEEFVLAEGGRRTEQPTESEDRMSDLGQFEREADHVRAEAESIWKSKAPAGGDQEFIAHRFEMTTASESATQSNLGDPQRQADSMPKPQRSPIHGSDGDGLGPASPRFVAFEVSRPDLGHVHVRVAVRNDLVHAHLSSDRPDVAHYLAGGHDRLQSALQANGLEMGHFRVDIDRHGAGRSFHQGPSYGQDHGWRSEKPAPEQHHMTSELSVHAGAPYAGMLNVVA